MQCSILAAEAVPGVWDSPIRPFGDQKYRPPKFSEVDLSAGSNISIRWNSRNSGSRVCKAVALATFDLRYFGFIVGTKHIPDFHTLLGQMRVVDLA